MRTPESEVQEKREGCLDKLSRFLSDLKRQNICGLESCPALAYLARFIFGNTFQYVGSQGGWHVNSKTRVKPEDACCRAADLLGLLAEK